MATLLNKQLLSILCGLQGGLHQFTFYELYVYRYLLSNKGIECFLVFVQLTD